MIRSHFLSLLCLVCQSAYHRTQDATLTLSTCEKAAQDNTVKANIHVLNSDFSEEACASAERIISGCAKGSEIDYGFLAGQTYFIVVDTYGDSNVDTVST